MIRRRPEEQNAVRAAGVGMFIFNNGNVSGNELAQALLTALPEMLRLAREQPRPFIASVDRFGVVRLYPQ